MAGAETTEHLQSLSGRLGPIQVQQNFTQPLAYTNRRIRGCVGATGDATFDLAKGNLVGHQDGRLQAGSARLLDIIGGRFRSQSTAERRFPGQVEIPGVLDDSATNVLPQTLSLQAEAIDQPP